MSELINWPLIFSKQKKLSAHIEENHPRKEGESRAREKAFALMAELMECGNEWRGFKFWSNDQKPRTSKTSIGFSNPSGAFEYTTNPLLEEYIDSLHFVAELGIELGVKDYQIKTIKEDTLGLFAGSMYLAYIVGYGRMHRYDELISYVTQLGESLGFTAEEIQKAYDEKNKTNYARQSSNY